MADLPPIAVDDIDDPDQVRAVLYASRRFVHAPLSAVGTALKAFFDTLYQPLAATLTSWAAVVRASGFDTFAATPSSANLAALLTDESGTSKVAFEEQGTFTPAFSASGATFSYASRAGFYTKIGRMVFFDVSIVLNTTGNTLTANALTVTGLPFTSAGGFGIFPVRFTLSTTSYVQLFVRVNGATLVVESLTAAATSPAAAVANGALNATAGTTFRVIGSYFV